MTHELDEILTKLDSCDLPLGVVVVDHGSKRDESNLMLDQVVDLFRRRSGLENVEPAHMELAEPTIDQAFARCVERGARLVVVFPYFLGPGRHSSEDIPRLAAAAAARHAGIQHLVAPPLGLDKRMAEIISTRVAQSLSRLFADDAGEL